MRVLKRGHKVAAIAVAGMLLAAGCGGGDDEDPQAGENPGGNGAPTGEITVQNCKPQNPLVPSNTNEVCGGDVLDQVTAKLIRYNPETGEIENDIAESIETKNSKVFTIKLRDGVKFTDGTPVDAKSFVDAWNWGAYGPNAQLSASFYEPIKGYDDVQGEKPKAKKLSGLKVVDDLTFTVETDQKYSPFPRRLGYTAFAALPTSFYEDDGKEYGKLPIGAGPFKMVSGDPAREFVLEANPDYDGPAKPSIAKVTFRTYDTDDAAYNDLLAGNLDIGKALPSEVAASGQFVQDLGDRLMEKTGGRFSSISFPAPKSGDTSYDNPKLRHAISMAIDRPLIAKTIFFDTVLPAEGWLPPTTGGFKEKQCGEYCTYNPTEAKKLYDEAGGHKGPITISYNADGPHKAWTEAACNQIKASLGAECIAKPVPLFASFRESITKKEMKGLFRTGWQMDYPYIENYLQPLYSTGAGSNDGDYSNKEFDATLKQAAAAATEEEAIALYQKAEAMLAEDMPVIPLWYPKTVSGHSDRIAEAKFTVFGTIDLSSIVMK